MSRIRQKKQGDLLFLEFTRQDNVVGKITFDGTSFIPSHPFSLTGDGAQQIEVTSGFSGTDMVSLEGTGSNSGILISGACGKGIEITGDATTGIGILTGTYTTGISVAGTTGTGIAIDATTTAGITIGATATGISIGACSTAHITTSSMMICDMPVPDVGTDIQAAEVAKWIPFGKKSTDGLTVTEFYIDLVGLASVATGGDAIGDTGETGPCYLGKYTTAVFGTIVAIEMICLEAPTTGDPDIDLKSIVTSDITIDGAVAGDMLIDNNADWTNGMVKGATAVPTADHYFYLVTGSTDAGEYATGKFLIRFYGV